MEPIDISEILSRFILKKNYIRANNTVRPAVFMPNPKNGETSVFRTSDTTNHEIWAIGEREIIPIQKKPILGRADIGTSIVVSKNLKVIPSEPPERHADIIGWPDEKSKQKLIALELAAESEFHKKEH